MNPTEGIQTLGGRFRSSTGVLASDTAVQVHSTFATGLTRTFLCKRFRLEAFVDELLTDGEGLIVGVAQGSATVAEIATQLTSGSSLADPKDPTNWAVFGQNNIIWWQTLRVLDANGGPQKISCDVAIGGKNGIPMIEDQGAQLFVFNPHSAALAQACNIQGIIQFVGVFMRD